MKTEILYGIHSVAEALSAGRRQIHEILLVRGKKIGRLGPIISMAESRGIFQRNIGSGDFEALVGPAVHQGVAARVSPYPLVTAQEILQAAASGEGTRFMLILDNVVDPQNLGALIRTAVCVGIDGVFLPKDHSASPTPAVSRASAGALEHVHLSRVTNLVQTIKICKSHGVWVFGLQQDAQQSIFAGDLTGSIALVVGGEQKGIRPLVRKHCDLLFSIPQLGPIDSLNASAAGAVAMYEALRQRQIGMTKDE